MKNFIVATIAFAALGMISVSAANAAASCNGKGNCVTNTHVTNNKITNNNSAGAVAGATAVNKSKNVNNNSATATGGKAVSGALSVSKGGNAKQSAKTGDNTVSVSGDRAAASSAGTVVLTSSNDTCMGSSGIGGQGMNFGFAVGTTWTDNHCKTLKAARELRAAGFGDAGKARLCMDSDIRRAFALTSAPCPQTVIARRKAAEDRKLQASATATPTVELESAAE